MTFIILKSKYDARRVAQSLVNANEAFIYAARYSQREFRCVATISVLQHIFRNMPDILPHIKEDYP